MNDIIQSLTAMKSVVGVNQLIINETIEKMQKYQKIEQIVSDFREYQKGISCGFGGATYMQMVSEVVEDE